MPNYVQIEGIFDLLVHFWVTFNGLVGPKKYTKTMSNLPSSAKSQFVSCSSAACCVRPLVTPPRSRILQIRLLTFEYNFPLARDPRTDGM